MEQLAKPDERRKWRLNPLFELCSALFFVDICTRTVSEYVI